MYILSLLILALWLMALGRTILNLALVPRLRVPTGELPAKLVSVIIPARDEERMIERAVLTPDRDAAEIEHGQQVRV